MDKMNQFRDIAVSRRSGHWRLIGASVAVAVAVAGCSPSNGGSSGGSSSDNGLSGAIDVVSIQDLSGPVGNVGIATQNGMELAEKQVNDSGMLGKAKLKISYKDTQTQQSQAVSLMSSTVSTGVTAIFGPVSSQEAVAMSPVAQSAKIPTIFTQAGSPGVLSAGDYNFRVTSPQDYYQPKMVNYLKSRGIKTVSFLYDSTVPPTKDLTEKTIPPLMKTAGITIKDMFGFQNGTTDYSAYVSKIISQNPDAVGTEGTNPEASPVVSSLRNAGYKGLIFGGTAFGAASLAAAGSAANGVVWATDFDPRNPFPKTQQFVKEYTAMFNTAPANYSAEGYDAVYLLALGLQKANSTDHGKLKEAMQRVSAAGYDGALGPLKFDGNDLRQEGYLQTIQDGVVRSAES